MIQPNELRKSTCTLPPPNEMILHWAEERPNEVYLKQIINRQFVEFTYAEVADKALKLVSALQAWYTASRQNSTHIKKLCRVVYL